MITNEQSVLILEGLLTMSEFTQVLSPMEFRGLQGAAVMARRGLESETDERNQAIARGDKPNDSRGYYQKEQEWLGELEDCLEQKLKSYHDHSNAEDELVGIYQKLWSLVGLAESACIPLIQKELGQ